MKTEYVKYSCDGCGCELENTTNTDRHRKAFTVVGTINSFNSNNTPDAKGRELVTSLWSRDDGTIAKHFCRECFFEIIER